MANVTHSAITDAYKHEPKGADTASKGEVYISDGAGSGSWTKIVEKVFESRGRLGKTSEWEMVTGLSGYSQYIINIGQIVLSNSGTNLFLHIETGGSFATSGYEGAILSETSYSSGITQGFLLSPSTSSNKVIAGQYFLANTGNNDIVTFSGSTIGTDAEEFSKATGGSSFRTDSVFGRYNSNASITGFMLDGDLSRGGDAFVTIYGIRG